MAQAISKTILCFGSTCRKAATLNQPDESGRDVVQPLSTGAIPLVNPRAHAKDGISSQIHIKLAEDTLCDPFAQDAFENRCYPLSRFVDLAP